MPAYEDVTDDWESMDNDYPLIAAIDFGGAGDHVYVFYRHRTEGYPLSSLVPRQTGNTHFRPKPRVPTNGDVGKMVTVWDTEDHKCNFRLAAVLPERFTYRFITESKNDSTSITEWKHAEIIGTQGPTHDCKTCGLDTRRARPEQGVGA